MFRAIHTELLGLVGLISAHFTRQLVAPSIPRMFWLVSEVIRVIIIIIMVITVIGEI